jgi:hypothetical protein
METPPYQPDNYRRPSRKKENKYGSLNENLIAGASEVGSVKKSQHGSINDD